MTADSNQSPLVLVAKLEEKLSNNKGPDGPLGVIEEGAHADILLVDGNPLEDITVIGGNPKLSMPRIVRPVRSRPSA